MGSPAQSGGELNNQLHLYRPLLSTATFRALQQFIAANLFGSLRFTPRPPQYAGVSLIDQSMIAAATKRSRRPRKLAPQTLAPRLRGAVPPTGDYEIEAAAAKIQPIRRLGKDGMALAIILGCDPVAREMQVTQEHVMRLGNVGLLPPDEAHLSLGAFNRPVPGALINKVTQQLPPGELFLLGSVLPPGVGSGAA
jgi:hypothetical protein